jgi:hypothetical protein
MDERELFGRLGTVAAPADFETRVLARLADAKARRARRVSVGRLAWAGAATAAVVGIVFLAVPRTGDRQGLRASGAGRGGSLVEPVANVMPIMETMDFGTEIRNLADANERNTVYILEQVAEGAPSGVKF